MVRGTTVACLIADGGDFRSRPVDGLDLDFGGIAGDIHAGAMRKAGSREPWYPRGTPIRNNRQITLVGSEELAAVAAGMELPEIAPGWIGANLVTEGVPDVTRLPIGTRLIFSGAAVLFVEGENAPCRIAGRSIAEHYPGREGLDLLFPKIAIRRRGLIATVERPGRIARGETFTARIPAPQKEEA